MSDTTRGPTVPYDSTGITGLDAVLGGGLTHNRLYLVDGNPGSGKTTLALQFLLAGVHNGEHVLYVTLSETAEELHATATSHGWTLAGIELFELIPSAESLSVDAQYTMFHPSEIELAETTKLVIAEVERVNPSRVVIDSLSDLRLLSQNSLRYRRQVLAFKQFFARRGCTLVMLDDRTSEEPDLQLHSIAHGVLALEHIAPEYGAERRRLTVIKMRGRSYSGGFHDFKIVRGGIEVYPRLVATEHSSTIDMQPLPSSIAELDLLLGGGIDRGTSTLFIGPAGVGKSSLAAQYVAAAAERGENCAMFVFDETLATMRRRSAGIGLHLEQHIESGRVHIQQVDPAELSPGEFAHIVRKSIEDNGVRMVVIDSLNGYLNAMSNERFLLIQLHELFTYLNQQGVSTLLILSQQGLIGDTMRTQVDVSYLTDNVVLMRYFESAGEIRQAISVVKKRSGAHERTLRELHITANGITVGRSLRQFHGILTGIPQYTASARNYEGADRDDQESADVDE